MLPTERRNLSLLEAGGSASKTADRDRDDTITTTAARAFATTTGRRSVNCHPGHSNEVHLRGRRVSPRVPGPPLFAVDAAASVHAAAERYNSVHREYKWILGRSLREHMTRDIHVVAVCGSLAAESVTRVALREVLTAAEHAGAETTLVDLREYEFPTFDADDQDAGDAPALRAQLRAADAIALGTPMYHGSFSSPLKTALDYSGFDEFEETTVGLLAVSGGAFPTPALEHLRAVVRALDAWPLPLDVAVPNSHEQVADGTLADEALSDRAARLGTELVEYANVAQYPAIATRPSSKLHAD